MYSERCMGANVYLVHTPRQGKCVSPAVYPPDPPVHHVHMRKTRPNRNSKAKAAQSRKPPRAPGTYGRTFLKEWREHAGLTQERAASRIGEATGEGFSHSQLSRIERGEQPYSQAVLEAAAHAYGTDPASLLIRNPKEPDAIWSVWDQALPGEKLIILDTAQAIIRRRAG